MTKNKRRLTIYMDEEVTKRLQHLVIDKQENVKSLSQLVEEMCRYCLNEKNDNSDGKSL